MRKFFAAAIAIIFISCKSKEEDTAQKAIDRYVIFVDSVNTANYEKRKERQDFIESEHARKLWDAEEALEQLDAGKRTGQEQRINERYEKYLGVMVAIDDSQDFN